MEAKATNGYGSTLFEDTTFLTLVHENSELSELRREFDEKPADERRMAADYEYHS